MPLVRIDLRRGTSPAYRASLRDGVYRAMRESFQVPADDRFILVHQHDAEDFDYDPGYLGIARSDALVIIQVTCNNSRDLATKQAFYRSVVKHLTGAPGLRPEDVFINLVETDKVNWSFGLGIAQYA